MNENNNQSNSIKAEDQKAFSAILKQHGLHENDYQAKPISQEKDSKHFSEKDGSQDRTSQLENHSNQKAPQDCQVLVKNAKTGQEKTYQAGEGSHWVKDFENDLKNKQFK